MTDRELMQMALDALEKSRVFVTTKEKIKHPEGTDWYDEQIKALRDRLAQPEMIPITNGGVATLTPLSELLSAQPEPEPVSWYGDQPLYAKPTCTAPPKREWVGLTDEEIDSLWAGVSGDSEEVCIWELGHGIEAKLKEKNT